MKFDAQRSSVIIVVVQVGAVKIYVAAVEALKKKERGGWSSLKIAWKLYWVETWQQPCFFSGDETEGNLYKGFFGGKSGPKSPDWDKYVPACFQNLWPDRLPHKIGKKYD